MSGVNKVIILGRLGKDPETKQLDSGSQVCNFSVATSESYTDKAGKKVEKTEWTNIVAFGKLADICAKYLTKGREVYVEGKLQTDSYLKNDETRYSTKVLASAVQFIGGQQKAGADSTDASWDAL
mgnify:CR=1 FL=1